MNALPLKVCMYATVHVMNWTWIAHVRVRVAVCRQLNAILANQSHFDHIFVYFGEAFVPKPLQ